MFKPLTETLSKRVSRWCRLVRVCRQSAFAGNSGSVFLSLENPLCPRTIRSSQSPYSILPGTSLSLGSNGTGFGCSLFCLWLQVFSSRVFLESKYEVETNNFSDLSVERLLACLALLGIVLLLPLHSHAYAGPGAGFAVLSSFWTLFVAFFYSVYAFFAWPFRQLFRLLRRRKAYGKAQIKRAIILGFDGMDPELTERFIAEGKLPNLARLRERGTFRKLQTTSPAHFSGGVVNVHDRREPGQAQHLRFSRPGSQQLPSLPVLGGDQGTEAQLEDWQVHDPARRPEN